MTKFAAFIFLLITSFLWVPLFLLFGVGVLAFVIENLWTFLIIFVIVILWNMPDKEKPAIVKSEAPKAPRETYGHIFTKPKQ